MTRGTMLVFKYCSTRWKLDAWNNAYFQALFHASSFERVEQYLKTNSVPRDQKTFCIEEEYKQSIYYYEDVYYVIPIMFISQCFKFSK